jgi:DNA primase
LEHLINLSTKDANDIGQKKQAEKEILPIIKLLKSKTEQDHYLKMLALKLVVSEKSLSDNLKNVKTEQSTENAEPLESGHEAIHDVKILSLIMEKCDVLGDRYKKVVDLICRRGKLPQALCEKIQGMTPEKLQESLKSSKLSSKLKEVYFGVTKDLEDGVMPEDIAHDLVNKMERDEYEARKNGLVSKIAQADGEVNKKKRLELLKELNSVIINQGK